VQGSAAQIVTEARRAGGTSGGITGDKTGRCVGHIGRDDVTHVKHATPPSTVHQMEHSRGAIQREQATPATHARYDPVPIDYDCFPVDMT